MSRRFAIAALLALSLSACKEDIAAVPDPIPMTDEALGHYCQMFVADHAGPKAQIHLRGHDAPMWFSQVSDAVAYLHDPERDAEIAAIYVTDMSRAESWAIAGESAWAPAGDLVFVIESDRPGGMGVPEAIPYSDRDEAAAFTAEHGGRIVAWDAIPEAYVRPNLDGMPVPPPNEGAEG